MSRTDIFEEFRLHIESLPHGPMRSRLAGIRMVLMTPEEIRAEVKAFNERQDAVWDELASKSSKLLATGKL